MQSLKELFKVGPGPSSSHTIGPYNAAYQFKENLSTTKHKIRCTLFGSLSLTGKGHLTDWIILDTLKDFVTEIVWNDDYLEYHPNAMKFEAFDLDNNLIKEWLVYSVGGGTIEIEGQVDSNKNSEVYQENTLDEIYLKMSKQNISFAEYVLQNEDSDFKDYMRSIFKVMIETVENGLQKDGVLPGVLKLERVAKKLNKLAYQSDVKDKDKLLISSYAYAVSEENASGGLVVTAPTCGASGVIPALVYHFYKDLGYTEDELIIALIVAGLFGNIIKTNATISGAEGGCQAEVGSACSMAAAGFAYIQGLNKSQVEYAAEIGIEHHLGLTCDPIDGYVQIPCIERNGQAALRALDAILYAKSLGSIRINSVSFDSVVNTMRETGADINHKYRETALGGLATNYYENNKLRK